EDEVVLLIPLTLASNVEPGTVELKARADWLECKESCLNGGADLAVKLTIGNETRLSAAAGLIETWRNKIPNPTAQAWWEGPAKGDTRALIIEWASLGATGLEFFPYASDGAEAGASTEASPAGPGKVRIRTEVRRFKSAWPTQLSGVLVQKVGDRQFAQEVVFALSGDARPPAAAASTQVETSVVADASLAARPDPKPLWLMLIYAFVGG